MTTPGRPVPWQALEVFSMTVQPQAGGLAYAGRPLAQMLTVK